VRPKIKQLTTRYQEGENDCGAAAVAMLCGITYKRAAAVVFEDRDRGRTASGRLLAAVRRFGGLPLTERCIARGKIDLTELKNDALLKCQMLHNGRSSTHWAVWDCEGQTIRDPYGYWHPLKVTHLAEIAWPE
jgi:hypothetical protein